MTHSLTHTAVKDITGKSWQIGRCLGRGGFARVYETDTDVQSVIKIFKTKQSYTRELFAYQSIFTDRRVRQFKENRGLGHLGISPLIAHGTEHEFFIVIQKLFPIKQLLDEEYRSNNIVMMVVQLLDILEFMHKYGWTHNDIKYDNIMVDKYRNFYLIDFGLISSFIGAVEQPMNKFTRIGTQQYMSLDAHRGFINPPRGDLTNLIFMLKVVLTEPWDIHKYEYSVPTAILIEKELFTKSPDCGEFTEFCKSVVQLKYNTIPNYRRLKSLLPTQRKVNCVYKFYTQQIDISQPPWMFSIIFQTHILPFLFQVAKKLYALKSVKSSLINIKDIMFLLNTDQFQALSLDGLDLLGEPAHRYTKDAAEYISASIEHGITHMAKELQNIIKERKLTYNQAIYCLTKTLSVAQF